MTGLDPVLQGRASVALFPAGRVSFDDVTLGDNRTGAPALTAERVVARLRFFPILIGRIEIADVSLVRPTIAIVFEADRSSNWSGHIEALARNLKRQPNPAASFSEIRIEDGTIILRDQTNNVVETLSHVEFALAWPSIARSFAATGGFIWRDEQMAASISLTDFVAALQGDRSGLKNPPCGRPAQIRFRRLHQSPAYPEDGRNRCGGCGLVAGHDSLGWPRATSRRRFRALRSQGASQRRWGEYWALPRAYRGGRQRRRRCAVIKRARGAARHAGYREFSTSHPTFPLCGSSAAPATTAGTAVQSCSTASRRSIRI